MPQARSAPSSDARDRLLSRPAVNRLFKTAAAVLLFAGVAAAGATAAAQHISPVPGEVVRTAHPVFRWSLPANEQSEAVYVASRPETTPEGRFFEENIEDIGAFLSDTREWAPSSPLGAGNYWWNVRSTDRNTFSSYFSAPTAFAVAAEARIHRVRLSWRRFFGSRELTISIRWGANTRESAIYAEVLRGRRRIWRARRTSDIEAPEAIRTESFTVNVSRRVKRGTRLTVRVVAIAGGARARSARTSPVP
jgi:hypothetical protein